MSRLIMCFLTFSILSCKDKAIYEDVNFSKNVKLNQSHVMQIPLSLRQKLDEDFFSLSPRPIEMTETQKKVALKNVEMKYLNFQAMLLDLGGALKERSYSFEVDGGGLLDFSNYMAETKSDFIFALALDPRHNIKNTRVYFLDNLKARGCSSYKDISAYFFSTIAKKGLLTTSKDFIHLKLLSGAIIFISNVDENYYLGQLYISDQRLSKIFCR